MSLRLFAFAISIAIFAPISAIADVPFDEMSGGKPSVELSSSSVVNLIHQEADRQGVPRDLAIKVAKRESGLRCNAYNKKDGTSGLFQLKPATARGLGFRGNTSELLSCNAGLTFGMKHLAICYRLANGNYARADACHRGGFRSISGRQSVERELLVLND